MESAVSGLFHDLYGDIDNLTASLQIRQRSRVSRTFARVRSSLGRLGRTSGTYDDLSAYVTVRLNVIMFHYNGSAIFRRRTPSLQHGDKHMSGSSRHNTARNEHLLAFSFLSPAPAQSFPFLHRTPIQLDPSRASIHRHANHKPEQHPQVARIALRHWACPPLLLHTQHDEYNRRRERA